MEQMPPPNLQQNLVCGQCRWFYIGHNQRTCQKTRGVQQATRACIEFDPYKPSPYEKIIRDKYLVGLQQNIPDVPEHYIDQITKEIKKYRITASPKVDYCEFVEEKDMLRLVHSFEKCQAYMDRLVELRLELIEKQTTLQKLVKDAQSYLLMTYPEQIRGMKNESERGAFFHGVMPGLMGTVDKVQTLLNKVEILQSNLKDAHFSLRETQAGAKAVWDYRAMTLSTTNRSRGIG